MPLPEPNALLLVTLPLKVIAELAGFVQRPLFVKSPLKVLEPDVLLIYIIPDELEIVVLPLMVKEVAKPF